MSTTVPLPPTHVAKRRSGDPELMQPLSTVEVLEMQGMPSERIRADLTRLAMEMKGRYYRQEAITIASLGSKTVASSVH